jgi:hypothetical protein
VHKVSRQRAGGAVTGKARDLLVHTWESQANLAFFLGLLVFSVFVLPAIGFGSDHSTLYTDCVYSVLVISGVAIAWGRRLLFYSAAVLGLLAIVVRWTAFHNPTALFAVWREALTLATITMIGLILLLQIFSRGPVTIMRIQGAIAVYLLFGFSWAQGYMIAAHFNPAGFSSSVGAFSSSSDWMYYSFTTLTTLGYGDVVPTGRIPRMLAIGEALTGQLYLAVMIARLVAMQIVSWQEGSARETH